MTHNEQLLEAAIWLENAAELIETWGTYVSPYFQEKYGLSDDVQRIQSRAELLRSQVGLMRTASAAHIDLSPETLKANREALNLTQPGLAKSLNLSADMVSSMERGRRGIKQTTAMAVMYLLEIHED